MLSASFNYILEHAVAKLFLSPRCQNFTGKGSSFSDDGVLIPVPLRMRTKILI